MTIANCLLFDEQDNPKGLITADSTLRGLANLGVTINELLVRDVIERHHIAQTDVDVFDLLDTLNDRSAVLITDDVGRLVGIVTNADAAEYFRTRAEDLTLVEDIEKALQDHINAAFTDPETGDIHLEDFQEAVDEVFNAQRISGAKEAITRYHTYFDEGQNKPNTKAVKQLCEYLVVREKTLDDLTLNQLIEMFLHKKRWSTYGENFSVADGALRKLLSEVTRIRNTLAHFRDELTTAEREKLRWCADWFKRNPPVLPDIKQIDPLEMTTVSVEEINSAPLAESVDEPESRYTKLAAYLQDQKVERIRLTFSEIEDIIGSPLPPSAYEHRSWWANNSKSHVQSQQWLDAGWRVSTINMTEGAIVFVRAKEREAAYIDFFAPLLNELKEKAEFPVRDDTLTGKNWMSVISAYDSEQSIFLALCIHVGSRETLSR